MKIERLPNSLLNGKFLHCRPVEHGPIVEGVIIPCEGYPAFRVLIMCPARKPRSICGLRMGIRKNDNHCLYRKGDSHGEYQIIGPDADLKSDRGWR